MVTYNENPLVPTSIRNRLLARMKTFRHLKGLKERFPELNIQWLHRRSLKVSKIKQVTQPKKLSEYELKLYATVLITHKENGNSLEEWYAKLKDDPAIEYVQYDYLYRSFSQVPAQPTSEWWYGALGFKGDPIMGDPFNYEPKYAPAKIAIIDTWVDSNHPDLIKSSGMLEQWDFTQYWDAANPVQKIEPGEVNDGLRHGTHVAGIIGAENNTAFNVGIANKSPLLCLRAFNPDSFESILCVAIKFAVDNGAKVINASWGGVVDPDDGNSGRSLKEVIDYACTKGVVVVCATGDVLFAPGEDIVSFMPAGFDNVITVGTVEGGVSDTGELIYKKLRSSNFGTNVIGAPGTPIKSLKAGDYFDMEELGGSSMSTAFVCGIVARMLTLNPHLIAPDPAPPATVAATIRGLFHTADLMPDIDGVNFPLKRIVFQETLDRLPVWIDPNGGGIS